MNSSIERVDPALDAIVPAGAKIEKLAGGFDFTEGPIWFDAGYLIESYRQAEPVFDRDARKAPRLSDSGEAPSGYRLVLKAIERAGSSPEMEYAASLMKEGPASAEHRRRATSGAKAGSPLAHNLSR